MKLTNLKSLMFALVLSLTAPWGVAAELAGTSVDPASNEPIVSSMQSEAPDTSLAPAAPPMPDVIQGEVSRGLSDFHYANDFDESILIPIVSVLVVCGGGFVFIIYLVVLRNRAAVERRRQQQEQIQQFLDAGRDVPENLLREIESYSSHTNLAKGIKHTLVGLALVVFLTVLIGFNIGAVGLIVVAAGLSRILIWKLTQPKNS